MAETVQKEDFVELEYTARVKETKQVFDTTDEKTAKDAGIHNEKATYKPVTICLGEGHLLKGLDRALLGKEIGKKHTVTVNPEEGFGRKNTKLIQLIATQKFLKQGIQPMPGLQVNIDGIFGMIKNVSGGRTLVDFNHPLAGQVLEYEVKLNRKVTDKKEKVKALAHLVLQEDAEIEVKENSVTVKTNEAVQKETAERLKESIQKLIPSFTAVEMQQKKEAKGKQ
ncbi:peptidylprolyl isomerase [Candidatus Woesearchaeota archaeon]|nr:peptidylprolyl isomerase [Candidatus Woesearchaeota archaeon]